MAKADKSGKGGKGVSLAPKDAVVGGGLFGAGEAVAAKHLFGWFDYNGKRKKVPALLVTFERGGEEHIESYTTGNGFKPSEDGKYLIPKAGQTGLSESCKAMQYIRALQDECGMPDDFVAADITVLDGINGTLTRKQLEKVEGSEKAGSILLFTEADETPWESGGKKKKKKPAKGKKKDDDDDEDEVLIDDEDENSDDDDADDEDSDDDDDEEEDKPKGKKGKGGKDAKAKGGKKDADDDDEDEDEDESESDDDEDDADEDVVEEAVEALIVALEDGPLKIKKIADAVGAVKAVSKSKNKKAILALVGTEKFLKRASGWTFNAKTGTASLGD